MAECESELDLAEAVLSGNAAAADEFIERYYANILGFIESKCDPSDRDSAKDIVQSLMGDCTGGQRLRKYSGKGSLEGWLKTNAFNDLREYFRKENRYSPLGDDVDRVSLDSLDSSGDSESGSTATASDFHRVLLDATAEAFLRLRKQHPESLVMLRLKDLHGVSQKRIAAAFGIGEPEVSTRKKSGMEFLQSEVRSILNSHFPAGAFSMEDIREFAHHADDICHDEERASDIMTRIGIS